MPILQIGFCTFMKACVKDFKAIMKNVTKHIELNCAENDFRTEDPYVRTSFKEAVDLHVKMLR